MRNQVRTEWIGGLAAAFFAMSATAAPPLVNNHSRLNGNSVSGSHCEVFSNGQRCVNLWAAENYDVKGTYEFTEAGISFSFDFFNPGDGSWTIGWRQLSCPVDHKALTALPKGATLEATLDPGAPGCHSDGQIVRWDPINGYRFSPFAYTEARDIGGEWADPLSYADSVVNRRDTFHDAWSETSDTIARQCREFYGDLMSSGGFSIGINFFPFEGFDSPGWSSFHITNCNDHYTQR